MNTQTSSASSHKQGAPGVPCPRVDQINPARGPSAPVPWISVLPGSRLRRVTRHIQGNLDRSLTIAELAAVVYMSPYHFARLFKCSTGVPPHRFVVQRRIAQAGALLATEALSIAQISRMVGFRTPSHFTTVFHRAMGITPAAYRAASLREDRPDGERRVRWGAR